MVDRISWESPYKLETLNAAEKRWKFRFPPDLKRLFLIRKPVGHGVWDWDAASDADMETSIKHLATGFAFDVVYSGFWYAPGGEKPKTDNAPENWGSENVEEYLVPLANFITTALKKIPRPIPICGHRYMPTEPHISGLPILSIHQTDIIYYGRNLRDYFLNEFSEDIGSDFGDIDTKPPALPFWTDFLIKIDESYEDYSSSDLFEQRVDKSFSAEIENSKT